MTGNNGEKGNIFALKPARMVIFERRYPNSQRGQRLAFCTVIFTNKSATRYRKPRVHSSRDVTAPAERPSASPTEANNHALLTFGRRGRFAVSRRPLHPAPRCLYGNVRKRSSSSMPQTASRYLQGRHGGGRKTKCKSGRPRTHTEAKNQALLTFGRRGRFPVSRRPLHPALRFLHRNVRKRVGHPLPQTASR